MMSTVVSVTDMFVSGGGLTSTAEAMKGVHQLLAQKGADRLLRVVKPFYQLALNLLGVAQAAPAHDKGGDQQQHQPHVLVGNVIPNVEGELEHARASKNGMAWYSVCLCQAILAFYMHKFDLCREAVDRCLTDPVNNKPSESAVVALFASFDVLLRFYDAMSAICMIWREARVPNDKSGTSRANDVARQKKKYLAIAEAALARLEVHEASSPALARPKVMMVRAEMKVLCGQTGEALALYLAAADHAVAHGVISDRALACERAGLALRVGREDDAALDYLEDSCAYYRQYGAAVKVNQIRGNVIPGWEDQ
jgi:hypothetical protein